MARQAPELDAGERAQIADTLSLWGEVHPAPDRPLIQLLDGSELTPRDLAIAALEPDSPNGRQLYRVFAIGLIPDEETPAGETLDEILDDYRRDIALWRHEPEPA